MIPLPPEGAAHPRSDAHGGPPGPARPGADRRAAAAFFGGQSASRNGVGRAARYIDETNPRKGRRH